MKNLFKKLILSMLVIVTITSVASISFAADYDDPPHSAPIVIPVK
jgi:hypothetical protein